MLGLGWRPEMTGAERGGFFLPSPAALLPSELTLPLPGAHSRQTLPIAQILHLKYN